MCFTDLLVVCCTEVPDYNVLDYTEAACYCIMVVQCYIVVVQCCMVVVLG
jgi:hypothetical protein